VQAHELDLEAGARAIQHASKVGNKQWRALQQADHDEIARMVRTIFAPSASTRAAISTAVNTTRNHFTLWDAASRRIGRLPPPSTKKRQCKATLMSGRSCKAYARGGRRERLRFRVAPYTGGVAASLVAVGASFAAADRTVRVQKQKL
jgi:hypothetical protein